MTPVFEYFLVTDKDMFIRHGQYHRSNEIAAQRAR